MENEKRPLEALACLGQGDAFALSFLYTGRLAAKRLCLRSPEEFFCSFS
jgi:hypothetical protein